VVFFSFCQILELLRLRGIFVFLSDFKIATMVWYFCASLTGKQKYHAIVARLKSERNTKIPRYLSNSKI
jgi:hypothetical protein